MNRQKAEKLVKRKTSRALPCPFCGNVPEFKCHVDADRSARGSIGHWISREPCCKVMGLGQCGHFFTNDGKPADFGLWKSCVDGLVDQWNRRKL